MSAIRPVKFLIAEVNVIGRNWREEFLGFYTVAWER